MSRGNIEVLLQGVEDSQERSALESFMQEQMRRIEKEANVFTDRLKTAQAQEASQDRVARIPEHLRPYFQKAAKLQEILRIYQDKEPLQEIQDCIDGIDKFLKRDEKIQVAIIGAIKAGKSTLINAMLKQDLASVDSTPETAVLTKFSYGTNNTLHISFYNEREWREFGEAIKNKKEYKELNPQGYESQCIGAKEQTMELNKENLARYTSSKSPEHFFAKEIHIKLKSFPFSENIVLIDTPGLDDPVPYRSNITRKYIENSDVVIVCVNSKALEKSKIEVIQRVIDNTGGKADKVYVLGTQIDILNDPQHEWQKHKDLWVNILTQKTQDTQSNLGYTRAIAERNIIGISAHITNLCRKYRANALSDVERKNLRSICLNIFEDAEIDGNIEKLEAFSGITKIEERMQRDIIDNAQERIRESIAQNYVNLKERATKALEQRGKRQEETLQNATKDVKNITESIEEMAQKSKELEDNKVAMKNHMDNVQKSFTNTIQDLKKQIKEIEEKVKKEEV